MSVMDRWILRFSNRLAFGQFLSRSGEWLAGYLFVAGTLVLLAKLALPGWFRSAGLDSALASFALPGFDPLRITVTPVGLAAGVIPVVAAAWWFSRRSPYSRCESVAMLDRRLEAGGLLMTLSEAPDEEWTERLPQLERMWRDCLPRVRPVRFAKLVVLPGLFAAAVCIVPVREAKTESLLRNTVGRQASQQLEEMLRDARRGRSPRGRRGAGAS